MTSADSSKWPAAESVVVLGICYLHFISVHVAGRSGFDCYHFRCALKKGA